MALSKTKSRETYKLPSTLAMIVSNLGGLSSPLGHEPGLVASLAEGVAEQAKALSAQVSS